MIDRNRMRVLLSEQRWHKGHKPSFLEPLWRSNLCYQYYMNGTGGYQELNPGVNVAVKASCGHGRFLPMDLELAKLEARMQSMFFLR